ncbi:hypothetical protein, partial [Streptomyces kronopolitis]|uniref:hypothetical protein n=1 Tax=Streptomyces kronopolitis TaxID=1612435 RepID=UPI0020C08F20
QLVAPEARSRHTANHELSHTHKPLIKQRLRAPSPWSAVLGVADAIGAFSWSVDPRRYPSVDGILVTDPDRDGPRLPHLAELSILRGNFAPYELTDETQPGGKTVQRESRPGCTTAILTLIEEKYPGGRAKVLPAGDRSPTRSDQMDLACGLLTSFTESEL